MSIFTYYVQDTDKRTAGSERGVVDGHRDEDSGDGRRQLYAAGSGGRSGCIEWNGGLGLDGAAVAVGVFGILLDVYRSCRQILGADPGYAGSENLGVQDLQSERVSDYRLHDRTGHHAEAYPWDSDVFFRLVLLRPGAGPAFGRHPFSHSMVAGAAVAAAAAAARYNR